VHVTTHIAEIGHLEPGNHVCWLVEDQATYIPAARAVLSDGGSMDQRLVLFGPEGSAPLAELCAMAAIVVDPHVAFLDRGQFDPETIFAVLREQSALARADGHSGLRVVADMDWMLPGRPTTEAIIRFELLLDRVVAELNATVVCAYRRSSFDLSAISAALSVHDVRFGHDELPQFSLVAGAQGWRLSGEIDLAVHAAFAAALEAASSLGDCEIDVVNLTFVDVAGMRAIADAARAAQIGVRLRGASPMFRRSWRLAGFEESAPTVQLVA
jgi:anti-anti-sigma regulatory factor